MSELFAPAITAEDAEEWTQSLSQIGAGWWRQRALAMKQGVPAALGLSLDEWSQRLGGYIRMAVPERREAVAELASEGMTQREIAGVLGVGVATVNRDLDPAPDGTNREYSSAGTQVSTSHERTRVPSGTESIVHDEPLPIDDADDDELMNEPGQDDRLAEGPIQEREPTDKTPEPSPEPARARAALNDGDEWYTPRWLFDALGIRFTIDVCAPYDLTYSSVPADRHFNADDDGLAQPWDGTVWCNPPYSKPEPWARRMIHHRDGLLLTHIPMNAGWCVDMWEACDGIRLFQAMEFVRPDGSVQRPGYWLQLAAFGPAAMRALSRLQPLGDAAANKRRIASPMWTRLAKP